MSIAEIEDKKFNRWDYLVPPGEVKATILVNAQDREEADAVMKEMAPILKSYFGDCYEKTEQKETAE